MAITPAQPDYITVGTITYTEQTPVQPSSGGMYFGTLGISKVFFGTSEVSKIYLGDVAIYEATATPTVSYTITTTVTNGSSSGDTTIDENGTATVTLSASSGYELPQSISVSGASYVYTQGTGTVSLSNPTGNVSISAVCQQTQAYDYSITVTAADNEWAGDAGINDGGTATIVFTAKTLGTNLKNSDITVTGATKSFDASTQTLTLSAPTGNVTVSCANTYVPTMKLYLKNETESSVTRTYKFRDDYNNREILMNGQKLQKVPSVAQYYSEWEVTIPPTNGNLIELTCLHCDIWDSSSCTFDNVVKLVILDGFDRYGKINPMHDLEELVLDINGSVREMTTGNGIWPKLTHVQIGPNVTDFWLRYSEGSVETFCFLTNHAGGGFGSAFPVLAVIDCDPDNPYFEMRNNTLLVRKSTNTCVAMTGSQDNVPNSVVALDPYWAVHYKGTTITTGSQIQVANTRGNNTITTWNIYNDVVDKCSTCLVNANFHEGFTSEIKDGAFVPSKALAALELPASVTKIGDEIVDTNVSTAEYYALRENGKLTYVSSIGYFLKVGSNPYYALVRVSTPGNNSFSPASGCVLLPTPTEGQYGSYNAALNYTTSATIPSSVKRIPDHFFQGKTNLATVTLNSGLLEIGESAFASCNNSSFTSITIPNTVTKIGANAFANTSGAMSLTSITFNEPSGTAITFGNQVFKVKTARSMTVKHKSNASVTGYNWSGDSITATFNVIS